MGRETTGAFDHDAGQEVGEDADAVGDADADANAGADADWIDAGCESRRASRSLRPLPHAVAAAMASAILRTFFTRGICAASRAFVNEPYSPKPQKRRRHQTLT